MYLCVFKNDFKSTVIEICVGLQALHTQERMSHKEHGTTGRKG